MSYIFPQETSMNKDELILKVESGDITPEQAIQAYTHGRTYVSKSNTERMQQYKKARALRDEIRKRKVPFITPNFLPNFSLCQGMILVGGLSGKGKSTAAANVLAGFLKHVKNGTAIVISNEENIDSIYDRVSCIMAGISYNDFLNNKVNQVDHDMIVDTSLALTSQIEVVDDDNWDMSCLEDVQAVLDHAAQNGVGLVVVDYYQTINTSRKDPHLESYTVLKKLGFYLKDYGRKHGLPVVVFAQLNPKGEGAEMQARVQNDKTVYNHAFTAIEISPDFETGLTTFTVHKDRFSPYTGKEVIMKFDKGKYVLDIEEEI